MDRLALLLGGVVVAACAVMLVGPPRAEACSPPPAVWVTESADAPITGVPVQGVVPIFSQNEPSSADLITVTVWDQNNQEVAGSWELLRWRLVWRSEEPLAPSTAHVMLIEDDWGQVTEVGFVTAAADAPAPAAPSLAGASWLGEEPRVDSQVCCGGEDIDTCSGQLIETCWAQSYVYLPRLSLSFEIDETARRYALFDVDAGGAEMADLLDASGVQQVDLVYGGLQASYCATVSATSLLDGSSVSAESCRNDAERQPAQPLEPEQPDDTLCGDDDEDDEPWDYDDWEEDDWKTGGDSHGCAAAGGGAGGGGLLALLALTVLPLAARRGRRLPA